MELPDPPEGWALKSLMTITEGTWSAQLWARDEYVYGYGASPRYAMLDALRRIEEGDTFERLGGGAKFRPAIDLVAALGIVKPAFKRRV